MRFLNPIKISYKNLMAARFRSFLTILGVIIGVASVIIIMSIGLSAQELILDQVKGIGSNLIGVLPGASDEDGPPAAAMGIVNTSFTYDDLLALKNSRNVPEVDDGAGYVLGTITITWNEISKNTHFTGTTASYMNVENAEMAEGRFFDSEEEMNLSRVAVLGNKLVKDIFGEENAIGQRVKINEDNFTVIGIFKDRGSAAFGSSGQDDSVFIPLKTAQKIILGINHLGFARLKVKSPDLIESAIANAKITLRQRHNIDNPANDDFSVRDQAAALEMIGQITDVLRYFLLAVGTISLIVGGVGIMNIMLIAVGQRIREVGLRKSLGAKNREIMSQFLAESVFVSLLGGIIGIILGISISFLASVIIQYLGYSWKFLISFQSIIVAVLVSIFIGIIFGLYPARKASRVSPMEALRYE
ncbi:MAG: multidrug ABC transporter substrate-binding protein [Candidatus Moranbacteria bacterium CG10_big_fil_rev_8_21_14_0_10_35_21]|nr:MAG: multidrug ABC transporter substrate-binding protein [Candidatus Moranbacteria bacterium CG10_big_fil_rev_8_21_14_0_10_35_21]PJA88926.1 MAG: multidrug ABC transporter substrate-binding protein [Candidatus Moranbacteria bacterium CG_4_9_14_3_um_filter_36_9]